MKSNPNLSLLQLNPEQQFLDVAPVLFIVLNKEGKIIKANKKASEILGYSEKKLIGMDWFDNFISADIREEIKQVFTRLMAGEMEMVESYENPIITKNNTTRLIAWHNILYKSEDGQIIGILSSGEDITDFKKNEVLVQQQYKELIEKNQVLQQLNKKLEESNKHEQFLANLLRNANQAVGLAYPDGSGKFLNKKGYDLLGYTENEIGRIKWQDITPEHWLASEEKELSFAIANHKSVTYIKEYIAKSGKIIPVELQVYPHFNEHDEFVYFVAFITDITERLQQRQALTESEEKFRTAFITSPDAISITRIKDGTYINVNQGFTEISGYSTKELIGKSSIDIDIWENAEDREKLIRLLKKDGLVTNMKTHFKIKDGSIITGLMSARVIHINKIPYLLAITRDITEMEKISEELKQKTNRLMQAESIAQIGYFDWDMKNDSITISDEIKKLYGVREDEQARRSNIKEILKSTIYPDDYEMVMSKMDAAIQGNKAYNLDHRIIVNDGRSVWVHVQAEIKKNPDGVPVRMLGVVRNINDQKIAGQKLLKSEEQYRTLFEQSTDPILIIEDYRFIQCNQATVSFLGYGSEDEVIMRSPHEHSPEFQPDGEASIEKAKRMIDRAVTHGHHRFDWVHLTADKKERWIDVSLTFIPGNKQVYTIWRDITERKLAEAELERYRHHLEEIVHDRTHELEEKNEELERFNRLFVGREFRIKELRDKVKALEAKLHGVKNKS